MHEIQGCLPRGHPTADEIDDRPANSMVVENCLLTSRWSIFGSEGLLEKCCIILFVPTWGAELINWFYNLKDCSL